MRIIILFLSLFIGSAAYAQKTYKELSEAALDYTAKDSLQKAEELFKEALKLEPTNPHNALLFSNLGTVQRRMGHNEDAIESYTYALNLSSKTVPILLNRASLHMEMGNQDRAYLDYCNVLDLNKNNDEALLYRAYIYMKRRDYKAAELDYKRLLQLQPESKNGRLGLATLYQKMKKYRESLDLISKLVTEYSNDAVMYIARADVERDMQHPDLALLDLDRAIELDASSIEAYLMRGEIYLEQKKKGLAKADFEKAVSLGVPQAELHDQMKRCK